MLLKAFESGDGILFSVELYIAVGKVYVQAIIFCVASDEVRKPIGRFFVFAFALTDEREAQSRIYVERDVERFVVVFDGGFVVARIPIRVARTREDHFVVGIESEDSVPIFDGTVLLVHAAVTVGQPEQRVKIVRVEGEGALEIDNSVFEGFQLSVTVSDRREHADVDGAFVEFEHLRPVVERVFVFFKVVVQMPEPDERVRVVLFHVEHFQIQLFRFFKIVYFSICVGHSREDGDVAVVVHEILFPDIDRFAVLVERFIAVGKSEERIIVSRMVGETVVVISLSLIHI